jgi:ABC-2 type transport system permease protein
VAKKIKGIPFMNFIKLIWHIIKNNYICIQKESRLKTYVIIFFFSFFWGIAFLFFYKGFVFLSRQIAGLYLIENLFFFFFFSLFIMLIVSCLIISLGIFFKSKEMAYLITTPAPISQIFYYKLAECIVYSSWAFFFLGTPLILAYLIVVKAPIFSYLLSPFFSLFFIIIPACLSIIIIIAVVRLIPAYLLKILTLIILLFFTIGFVISYFQIRGDFEATDLDGTNLQVIVDYVLGHLQFCHYPLLPSYWLSKGILYMSQGEFLKSFLFLAVIITNNFVLILISLVTALYLYYPAYSKYNSSSYKKIFPGKKINRNIGIALKIQSAKILPKFLRPLLILTVKDIKLFIRDPVQWVQFLIFFGLMGVYVINMRKIPLDIDLPYWRNLTFFLTFTAVGLISAALTTRFIYPLISLEGQRFWILRLSPVSMRQILLVKFMMSLFVFGALSGALIIICNRMLKIPYPVNIISTAIILINSIVFSALSVGLGALFPNFSSDNSARIVSGFGGSLNLVLNLVYLIMVIFFIAVFIRPYSIRPHALSFVWIIPLLAILLIASVTSYIVLYLGLKNLEKVEI